MFRNAHLLTLFLIAGAVLAVCALVANAADPSAILTPFVNDDTLGALYMDVGSLKVGEQAGPLMPLLSDATGDAKSVMVGAMMADGLVQRLTQAGGQGLFVVGGLGDIRNGGGPIGIASTRPGKRAEDVERLVHDLIRELDGNSAQAAGGVQIDVVLKGDAVLIGSKLSVARYAALKPSPRTELTEPLAKLVESGEMVAGVFCPGSDYRRVSRELWPELPGVLAPLRGELADRWLRFELAINPPPNARPHITLVSKDVEGARIFAQLWRDLPTATTEFDGNQKSIEEAKHYAEMLVDALPVKVEGATATIELPTNGQQLTKLRTMFGEAADKSMESSRRGRRVNQFKQLALAMLNYYDVNKHLPPAAICDKNGKPLLSWRVAVLPYLDENALYKQFHLDEPWDSPHNSSLVKKMPAIYADPDRKLQPLAREGKTTYQVPVGPDTLFHDEKGTPYRDVKDGTANTILVVEVEPENATEWTKPADWELDMKTPSRGLKKADPPYFTAAFADGHVQIIMPDKEGDQRLRAQLTRAGGEDIDRP
jgi:hypothetical protein